jgi:hypothetical protein
MWKENHALSKLGHHCYPPHVKTSVTGLALWINKHAWDGDVSVAQVQGNSDMIFHSASWEHLTYWSREMRPTQHWACALKTCDNLVFQTWILCLFYIIKVQEPNLILWKFYIRNCKDSWNSIQNWKQCEWIFYCLQNLNFLLWSITPVLSEMLGFRVLKKKNDHTWL